MMGATGVVATGVVGAAGDVGGVAPVVPVADPPVVLPEPVGVDGVGVAEAPEPPVDWAPEVGPTDPMIFRSGRLTT